MMLQPLTIKRCLRDLIHCIDNRSAPQHTSFERILAGCKASAMQLAEKNGDNVLLKLCKEIPEFTPAEASLYFEFKADNYHNDPLLVHDDDVHSAALSAADILSVFREEQKLEKDEATFNKLQHIFFMCKVTLNDIIFELNRY